VYTTQRGGLGEKNTRGRETAKDGKLRQRHEERGIRVERTRKNGIGSAKEEKEGEGRLLKKPAVVGFWPPAGTFN